MSRHHVSEDDAAVRLDVFVSKAESVTRAHAAALVDDGHVTVNGAIARKAYRVAADDVVDVAVPPEAEAPPPPTGVEVAWEDEHLAVVDKPSGVVVHAARGVRTGTLVDALLARGMPLAPRGGEGRPGIVHRLDRDVSGVLIVAKTDEAHERLVAAMKARTIERRYLALVVGDPPSDTGKIDAPVGRDPRLRTRMAVVPDGRAAVTWFAVTERLGDATLLDVKLETGRTHQIRTHLASIGHPIVGDRTYGGDPALAKRLEVARPFLHAFRLAFEHPVDGSPLAFSSPLPPELEAALVRLR